MIIISYFFFLHFIQGTTGSRIELARIYCGLGKLLIAWGQPKSGFRPVRQKNVPVAEIFAQLRRNTLQRHHEPADSNPRPVEQRL